MTNEAVIEICIGHGLNAARHAYEDGFFMLEAVSEDSSRIATGWFDADEGRLAGQVREFLCEWLNASRDRCLTKSEAQAAETFQNILWELEAE